MKQNLNKPLFFIGIMASLFTTANHAAACQYGQCWNAVAVGPNWAAGYVTDRATAPEAHAHAQRNCGESCDVVEVFDGGCGSLATSREGTAYFGLGSARKIAAKDAMDRCGILNKSCVTRITTCSR
ncbi:MAG: DUF4189 domain-containing protein [Roseovarius sp.]|nr:DUF4189 domain-containing protein [Roseovarius sp.]